jgi:hypothetical protein
MAIRLKNMSTTHNFVSDLDADKGNPDKETVFVLRTLSTREMAFLSDQIAEVQMETQSLNRADRRKAKAQGVELTSSQKTKINAFSVAIQAVRIGVVDIKNLLGEDGTPHPVTLEKDNINGLGMVDCLPGEILDSLGSDLCLEIYEALMEQNELKDEDAKNS